MKEAALVVLIALSAAAAEAPPQTTRATSAIVFKNGLSYITREGTVSFADGQATITPMPDAYLGTFWVAANGRTLDELRASKETYQTTRDAVSISDLIDANPGKVATIRVNDRDYGGTLVASAAPARDSAPQFTLAGTSTSTSTSVNGAEGALVLINVDGRIHAFPRSAVQSISFSEVPATTLQVAASRTALALHGKGANGSVPVTISYLRGGVSWMPEYSIAIVDGEHARLAMQATLLDDSEELRDTHVRFAVGYPNFQFSGVQSPLTAQQNVQQFVGRLNSSRRDDNVMMNVVTQNVMSNMNTGGDAEAFTPAAPATGEASEDLFFYERAGVTLDAGERASYPILAMTAPLRHVYEWEVPAETETTRYATPEPAKAGQVWHSIALTNSGTTPWTTGPAFVTANGKPLAQDTLSYTAAGATGRVKLTIATDVSVAREEKETGRKPHALMREDSNTNWTALSIEGTLRVRNYKGEAITLSIDKTVEGETLSSTPAAKVTKRALAPKAVNPTEKLEWEVPLAPGEAKTVRYAYKVYVRE